MFLSLYEELFISGALVLRNSFRTYFGQTFLELMHYMRIYLLTFVNFQLLHNITYNVSDIWYINLLNFV